MDRNASQDISLLELITASYRTLRRNLMLTVLLPFAGVAVGIAYHYASSDRFQASMLIETSLLTEQEGNFLLDQIDEVESLPGISDEDNEKVLRVKFDILEGNVSDDPEYRTILVKATARVTDPAIFPVLQTAVVSLMDSTDIVRLHRKERQGYYLSLISKIDDELKAMENVKTQVSGNVQATFLNPALLYKQTIELFREKAKLHMRVDEISSIRVVKEFDSLLAHKKLSLPITVVLGFVCGIALLILALFAKFLFTHLSTPE